MLILKLIEKGERHGKRGIEGSVVSVSAAQLVVQGKKKEITFVVTDKTKVKKGESDAAIADVAAGQKVHVGFKSEGKGMPKTATFIKILE